jgi:NAD(P)H-dependent FMN reductase
MNRPPRILAFSGSLREGSYNQMLVRIAASGAEAAGARVSVVDLRELGLPLYSGDLEAREGLPPSVHRLKDLMRGSDGFLIASPENNSSLSAALKNAIDWASRKADPKEPSLECFRGRVAGIMAASPGALGGLRGLVHLRSILENIDVMVIPQQKAIPAADKAFDANGRLRDPAAGEAVEKIGAQVASVIARLGGAGGG